MLENEDLEVGLNQALPLIGFVTWTGSLIHPNNDIPCIKRDNSNTYLAEIL